MNIWGYDQYFRGILDFSSSFDSSLNGVQVQNSGEIRGIAFSVDCTLNTLEQLDSELYNLLIVHHGLFWGDIQKSITGTLYKKLHSLLSRNVALYCIHLPLDTDPVFGNNIQLAKILDLSGLYQGLLYKTQPLGFIGSTSKTSLLQKLKEIFPSTFFSQKQKQIEEISREDLRVGISSGAFSSSTLYSLLQSDPREVDLVLTGEISLGVYNEARDASLPIIPLGHYYTETWGLQSLLKFMKKNDPSLNFNFIGDDKFI